MGFVGTNIDTVEKRAYNGIMDKKLKGTYLTIRTNPKELEAMDTAALAKGFFLGNPKDRKPNRSKYLRALIQAEKGEMLSRQDYTELKKHNADLYRLGTNLNLFVNHLSEQKEYMKLLGVNRPPVIKEEDFSKIQLTVLQIKEVLQPLKLLTSELLSKYGKV